METHVVVLALLASFPTAYLYPRLVVSRFNEGDIFAWYGTGAGGADCGQTAWLLGSNSSATRCQCNYKSTFSPEENKCLSYRSEGNFSCLVVYVGGYIRKKLLA